MQGKTDVHKAIETAKSTVSDLFEDCWELRLEEVEFDDTSNPWHWNVTVSFSDRPGVGVWSGRDAGRVYKVVRINDINGRVVSITNREFRFQD